MKKCAIAVLILSVFISCSHNRVTLNDIKGKMDTINLKINHGIHDTAYVSKTFALLLKYKEQEPADTNVPKNMLKMAIIMEAHGMYNKCIQALDEIQTDYPNSLRAAKACLTEGFIYDNYLKQLDKARAKYTEFLNKYGNMDKRMTDLVKEELQNLGKTPDQIFSEIQAKAKSDSVAKVSGHQ